MIGTPLGKIKDYGVSESKTGNPQVFITFEFEFEGAQKTMSWYGSFVGGAKDITLKTLIACGLQPQNYGQLVNFKNGIASNMLDLNKDLSLDVQEEPSYNDPSKIVSKIQWVNDPNSAPQIKKIDDAKNAQFFSSMGFDGDLIRLAGEMGISLNNGANATMGSTQNQSMSMGQGQMNMGNANNAQGANSGSGQATQYNQSNQNNGFAQGVSNSNGQAPQQNTQQGFHNPPAQQQNFNQQAPAQNNGQQNLNQNQGQNATTGFAAPF